MCFCFVFFPLWRGAPPTWSKWTLFAALQRLCIYKQQCEGRYFLSLLITRPKVAEKRREEMGLRRNTACFLCGQPIGAICECEWSACHRCVLLLLPPLLQADCTSTNITELLTRAKHCHVEICHVSCYYYRH